MQTPSFEHEGRDWPNRTTSRFVEAGGLRWHCQMMGQGPDLLLIHGTGASTHSWRDVAPMLALHFRVIAPDLPGHGFSGNPGPRRLSLPAIAQALAALLERIEATPALAVGHSAGAAILARQCLDGRIHPRALVSLNGALLPLRGLAGHWFSPAAKLFAANPLVPRFFAWQAGRPTSVERLVDSTGSRLDARGIELYRRLIAKPGHVSATIQMMANWDLEPMVRELPGLATPLILVVSEGDTTVRPAEAERVRRLLPSAEVVRIPALGHLGHEEDPKQFARLVLGIAAHHGLAVPSMEALSD